MDLAVDTEPHKWFTLNLENILIKREGATEILMMNVPIEKIVKERLFTHVFQPIHIVHTGEITGYESLIRCEYFSSPTALFQEADKKGLLFELDCASMLEAMRVYKFHYRNELIYPRLSVNILPSTLLNPSFKSFLEEAIVDVQFPMNRMVFEINEAEAIPHLETLNDSIHDLKSIGALVALDDLGKGQSSIRSVIELEPNIIKLDRYFGKDLSKHARKQHFLKSLVYFLARDHIVLEGIESEEDLECARKIGVHFGQGYYLGKPHSVEKCESFPLNFLP
ncbi:EAL domain-containing protein [Bacillus spongiae]|uniref:EAL domain-containing protein n=1 Tax=Bacillus spongiae TaxID=2683610 RepID=A0ABU8HE45_9BACI